MNKGKEILKNNRQLNYEILRIVAMLMIVCLHYLSKSGLLGNPSRANMTLTAYFAWFIEAFCLVAVNVYVLISGYFGAEKVFKAEEKTSWKIIQKPIPSTEWLELALLPAGLARTVKFHRVCAIPQILFVLALSCSFRLLLALYAGLLVVLSLAKLGKNTGTSALTLKATKGTVQRLAFFNFYFCHFSTLPPL